MSVKRAQNEIDSREFAEWVAFESIDPGGTTRSDWQAASICATIVNSTRTKGSPAKVKDYLLEFGPPKQDSQKSLFMKMNLWKQSMDQYHKKQKERKEKIAKRQNK